MQPSSAIGNDYYKWKHTTDGLFIVKSMKKILTPTLTTPLPFDIGYLWSSHLPKKCIIFIWTIMNRGLNIGDKCQTRNPKKMISPNWCILCKKKKSNETAEHMFIHCPFFKYLWAILNSVATSPLPESIAEMLFVITHIKQNSKKKVLWTNLIGACFWCIWLERNNKTFKDEENHPNHLWEDIIYLAALWSTK